MPVLNLPKTSKRPVQDHTEATPFRAAGNWVCRSCKASIPDDKRIQRGPVLCPICHDIMDLTPVRRK